MSRRRDRRGLLAACAGLVAAGLLIGAAAEWVDLRPSVGREFFFSSGSRTLRDAQRIEALFAAQGQLVVIAASPDIGSEAYRKRVEELGEALREVEGVTGVRSLGRGPDDLEEARESPLWRRLLLAKDGSASHLLLWVDDPWPEGLVPAVEAVVARHAAPGFSLTIAGVPYTIALMQRQLSNDFRVFGAAAVVMFGLASLALFRSLRVALGMLASCGAAVAVSFLVLQAAGSSLGLLSANLVTIVFVLTQSHLVFLTSNWQRAGGDAPVRSAMRQTLRPSLGSMATTLLGFGTLLFVDAKPLRELGLGGVVGSLAALAAAYGIHPLLLVGAPARRGSLQRPAPAWLRRRAAPLAAGVALACALAGAGISRLDSDPSLLAYFDSEGVVHRALAYLDRNVGSAPLQLVVRRPDRESLLSGDDPYESLQRVQRRLEDDPRVGTVVSLPVLLDEGERHPLSFLVPNALKLRLLESPLFERIGESFITPDRVHALFALQMVEEGRDAPRVEVVQRLRAAISDEGFEVPWAGGIYYLQGRLSQLVARSVFESLLALAVLFTAVAWATAGSFRVALAMTAVLALVPLAVFGGMGWLGVPLDVVAAPAASVGLGLAADAVLHLGVAARRAPSGRLVWQSWVAARASQWRGIARVSLLVAAGFALFGFSEFPPTRRFGLAVAAATLLAAPIALVCLPLAASPRADGEAAAD